MGGAVDFVRFCPRPTAHRTALSFDTRSHHRSPGRYPGPYVPAGVGWLGTGEPCAAVLGGCVGYHPRTGEPSVRLGIAGGTDGVTALAVAPAQQIVALGMREGAVQLWSVPEALEIVALSGHRAAINVGAPPRRMPASLPDRFYQRVASL